MYIRPVLLVLLTCAVISICRADNLTVGSNINGQLIHMEKVSLSAIPFKVRTKTVSYNGQQLIKGISAIDLEKSKTKVSIMAGGINFTYVTLRLKSERGDGLDYQIQIYRCRKTRVAVLRWKLKCGIKVTKLKRNKLEVNSESYLRISVTEFPLN